MKAIRVQYTVQPNYLETNKINISQVMSDLRALNHPDFKYACFLLEDGKTFMHLVFYPDDQPNVLNELDSFTKFRTELKASQPEVPPKSENLSLVAAGYDFFEHS